MSQILINNRYSLGKKIGSGSFGEIYLGIDTQNENNTVAIKLEKINPQPKYALLEFESKIYEYLSNNDLYTGIPKIYWKGIQDDFSILIIEALGLNLESLLKLNKYVNNDKGKPVKTFSLKTTLLIAIDFIRIMHYVHSKGIIHRDIKPENFLIGLNNNKIHVIDFGLAKPFRKKNKEHIPFRKTSRVIGTLRYCSINSHKGYELSRRDDLESIGYILIYFLKGSLPWQNLKCSNSEISQKVSDLKEQTSNNELCNDLPIEFKLYMDYVKTLEFDSKPNYTYLLQLFTKLFNKMNYKYDDIYDWTNNL